MFDRDRLLWRGSALLVFAAVLFASGIVPGIVPQMVPVLNKRGNSTIFALAASSTPAAPGTGYCDDGSGNLTTSGCLSGSSVHIITAVIDGGGAAIAPGDANVFPSVNFGCTIGAAMVSADAVGSITVDVWKANAAIPTSGDKISGTNPVTLASAQLNQASSLATWTSTTVSANDVFGFRVATATTVTRVTVQLFCQ